MPTFPFVVAFTAALTFFAPWGADAAPAAAQKAANPALPALKDAPRPWPPEPTDTSLPAIEAPTPDRAGDFGVPVLTPPSGEAPTPNAEPRVFGRAPNVGDDADDENAGGVEWRIEDRRAKHKNADLTLNFGIWPASIAGGLFAAVPVAPRGFLPSINDAFFIEFGLLLMGTSLWGETPNDGQFDILPALGVRWDFYLSRLVTLFGTIKLGPRIGVAPSHFAYPDPIAGVGTILNLSKRAQFRIELNYPQGFTFGLGIPLGHVD